MSPANSTTTSFSIGLLWSLLPFLSLFLQGCFLAPLFSKSPPEEVIIEPVSDLPEDADALVKLADKKVAAQISAKELAIAISALGKAIGLVEEGKAKLEPIELQLKLAIACYLASELEENAPKKMVWITKGIKAAEIVKAAWPDRVEGYYFASVLKGRKAEQGGLGAIAQLREIEELALKAEEIDSSFYEGGPLRLLAMFYASAPPWPTSVGDLDLALEYAEKAVSVADYPLNHLFLAEILMAMDEFGRARAELKKVLAAPKIGMWAKEGERWRPRASKLMRQLK